MADDVAAITREIRRLSEMSRKRAARRESTTGLTVWTLRTAMCIAALCRWDFSLAAEWVEHSKRRGAASIPLDDELSTLERLENAFMNSDADEITFWADPGAGGVAVHSVIRTAVNWVAGRRATAWVRDLNQRVGVAVRSQAVIQEFNAAVQRLNTAGYEHQAVLPLDSNPGKQWMRRWRKKHNGVVGRIRPVDEITLQEKRDKVSGQQKELSKVGWISGPENGPENWTKKWSKKVNQKMDHFFAKNWAIFLPKNGNFLCKAGGQFLGPENGLEKWTAKSRTIDFLTLR